MSKLTTTNKKLSYNITENLVTEINSVPAGCIFPFAGNTAPERYLFCDGSAVSRNEYSRLFSAISTTYGVGDGSTTFNLPDLRGYIPVGKNNFGTFSSLGGKGGSETETLTINNLPNHSHTGTTSSDGGHSHNYQDAFFSENINPLPGGAQGGNGIVGSNATDYDNSYRWRTATNTTSNIPSDIPTSTNGSHIHSFTTSAVGSGQPVNNLQPYIVVNYIIRV